MYISNLKIVVYPHGKEGRMLRLSVNGHHVQIVDDKSNTILLARGTAFAPDMDTWYDEKHAPIARAIAALDEAIIKAIE